MAQRMENGHPLGAPVPLCSTDALAASGLAGQAYATAPDGERFRVKVPAETARIIVVGGVLPRQAP